MTQLVQPNLGAVGRITYCLEYASRLVFQNPAGGTTAWEAWEVCSQQPSQNFPTGVSFPVWFSGAGGAGHVAVFTPQGIYSSPYNQLVGHAVLNSIAQVESTYSVKYVGWSPDILNLKVIGDDMADETFIVTAWQAGFNRGPRPDELQAMKGLTFLQVEQHILANNLDFRNKAANYDALNTEFTTYKTANPPIPAEYIAYAGAQLYTKK